MKLLVYTTSLSCKYIADACKIVNEKNKKFKFAFIFKKRNNFSDKDLRNLEYLKDQKNFFFQRTIGPKKIDNRYLDHFEKYSY